MLNSPRSQRRRRHRGSFESGAVIVHVGPPKTGTTALQNVAAASRVMLADHGVVYPGSERSHREALAAVMGIPAVETSRIGPRNRVMFDALMGRHAYDYRDGEWEIPPYREWEAVEGDFGGGTKITWLSDEIAASSSLEGMAALRDAVGSRLHVVVTVRDVVSLVPSAYQQALKMGLAATLEQWCEWLIDDESSPWHRGAYDHGRLVREWVELIGVDRVAVVTPDANDEQALFRSFERLLSLPDGVLVAAAQSSNLRNYGMGPVEAELLRQLNTVTANRGMRYTDRQFLIRHGMLRALAARRHSGARGSRLAAPDAVVERLRERDAHTAGAIAALGVRVEGNLDALTRPPIPSPTSSNHVEHQDSVPIEVALDAITGVVDQALKMSKRVP